MKRLSSPRTAFTLVEIMIVVAIIGVVVAIAMPAFLRSREISRARACQENLAKIDGATEMHAADNKLPPNAAVTMADLVKDQATGYLRAVPRCPSNGTYSVTTLNAAPTCSIGANPSAAFAPHQILSAVPVP